jgi:hypothetical protein
VDDGYDPEVDDEAADREAARREGEDFNAS